MIKFDTPPPCTSDPDAFFPEKGRSPRPAKALCKQCPARQQCLNEALSYGWSLIGVWGGTTDMDRRILRRQRV